MRTVVCKQGLYFLNYAPSFLSVFVDENALPVHIVLFSNRWLHFMKVGKVEKNFHTFLLSSLTICRLIGP